MTTLHEILDELREGSLDERDKGYLFEQLIIRWLQSAPEFKGMFSQVSTYGEWAEAEGISKQDIGIDLVARSSQTDELTAIQCKFYSQDTQIDKKQIDSFFTALNKKYFADGIIVSSVENWSKHAIDALVGGTKPVIKIGIHDLEDSGVDWSKFHIEKPDSIVLRTKKSPLPHQKEAIDDAIKHFKTESRGKLIMACGTGKTYTSLRITEALLPTDGTVLFLVPSLALLSQALREWKIDASSPFRAFAVCSDTKVGKKKIDEDSDISISDLAYPSTTNFKKLVKSFERGTSVGEKFTVVFSTYQSIEVISKAQKSGLPEFDLVVCDEAHRTTGQTLGDAEESTFVRVHDDNFIKAKKRVYMTATPRIYSEQVKQKAEASDILLTSMDDESHYGREFHRLDFGKAVSRGLLSDYKVLVLAISEEYANKQLQNLMAKHGEINPDDAVKLIGCYNGLIKKSLNADDFLVDGQPMKSAVAFARSIKDSKRVAELFGEVAAEANKSLRPEEQIRLVADHVDGTYNMELRTTKLDWLKASASSGEIRVLSNARCLSEGVDVPALDAVLFLSPRNSQVDVVQSVGRVMRKADGKKYGYVILPITVPAGMTAEDALADNEKYKVVWQVLQALRAHDERFDAIINKIEFNGATDEHLQIIGVGEPSASNGDSGQTEKPTALTLDFNFEDWKDAILTRIVNKVGNKGYWEDWAKDVTKIAQNHIKRIQQLLSTSNNALHKEFSSFHKGLQDNLNPHLTETEAIEMLAQHLITKPVFDALFDNYAFTDLNPVSIVMQRMLSALNKVSFSNETAQLEEFYESVRIRAAGIQDASGKQKVIKELYEKFFKIAFAKDSERLGIVYTPNEIVDFMLRITDGALSRHFNKSIGDKEVVILDPFTGTGTFIVRLIQSSLISDADLARKFRQELHANEIVLLAYYVAAINIEEAFHNRSGSTYEQFNGVVLTDTFQMYEGDDRDEIKGFEVFAENNSRVLNQKNKKITVVVGNPPYSAGQSSSNDNNANVKYPSLDNRIAETFGALSNTRQKNTLYDSYIRAIRWSVDRVSEGGIVAFVTNNGYLDSITAEGVRKSLVAESTQLYVVNLRGNSRALEIAKKEGGNVFDVRVGISIIFIVKSSEVKSARSIRYFESPDSATKLEKLSQLEQWKTLDDVPWVEIEPNAQGDWLNQRSSALADAIPLTDATKKGGQPNAIFRISSAGTITHRDAWVFNFGKKRLEENVKRMLDFYNSEVKRLSNSTDKRNEANTDPTKISWSHNLWKSLQQGKHGEFRPEAIRVAQYRPFVKTHYYSDKFLSHSLYQLNVLFPAHESNEGILTTGVGMKGSFKAMGISEMPELQTLFNSMLYPRWFYPKPSSLQVSLFEEPAGRVSAISDYARQKFTEHYGRDIDDDSIFYYVFGLLSHSGFIDLYSANLTREVPSIPLLASFEEISKAGKDLFKSQVSVELKEPFPAELVWKSEPTKDLHWAPFRTSIVEHDESYDIKFNSQLVIRRLPKSSLTVKFGNRSAVEWVIDRLSPSIDKKSQIENLAFEFFDTPQGSLNYLLKVVTASAEFEELSRRLDSINLT